MAPGAGSEGRARLTATSCEDELSGFTCDDRDVEVWSEAYILKDGECLRMALGICKAKSY